MFIVKFQGALGNQMFEYAFMLRLQKEYPENNVKAYIPCIRDFNGYEIEEVFGINIPKASAGEVSLYSSDYPDNGKAKWIMSKICKANKHIMGLKRSHIKADDYSSYYEELFSLSTLESYFLDGVWVNAKYLKGVEEDIRKAFSFKKKLDDKNLSVVNKMKNENSVSIHVRRNEYVTLGLTVTSDEYYKNAVKRINENISNPVYYVFSDDLEYCKKLFAGLIDFELVDWNRGRDSYKDMQLMSNCKHNIIANSTFSFWSAFLNPFEQKFVIAPNVSYGKLRHPFACEEWNVIDV